MLSAWIFLFHAIAERRIDELVPLDRPLAFEGRRHDRREEMLAVAFDFQMSAGETAGDVLLDLFGSRQHEGAPVGARRPWAAAACRYQ